MSRYSSVVMDHFEDPRNCGTFEAPDAIGRSSRGGGGPRMMIQLKRSNHVITEARFQTFGCGFSIAACSMLTELVTGKTIAGCRLLSAQDLDEALEHLPPDKAHCPLLAVAALQDALGQLKSGGATDTPGDNAAESQSPVVDPSTGNQP